MKKRLLRTGIVCIIEIFAVYFLMALYTFDSLNISDLLNNSEIRKEFDRDTIIEGSWNFDIQKGKMKALTDDPWIELGIKGRKRVDRLIIEIDGYKNERIQVFYSGTNKIIGDKYIDVDLSEGINEIKLPQPLHLSTVRFDLTGIKGKTFGIPNISVCYEKPDVNIFSVKYLITISILCILTVFILHFRWFKKKIIKNEKRKTGYLLLEQIFSLAYSDFKSRFSGSYLGITWGILQPLSTILLFWFVFQVGFRSNPIDDVPFILWLAAGMIPWNFFFDSWMSGTGAFVNYAYIVKKVVFKIEVLPIVKLLSSFILNLIFNGILLVIYIIYGRFPGFHIIDMIYYSLCLAALSLGLSYVTATLNVFIKDIGQFLGIVLQFLMWLTPMMWSYSMIPASLSWFYELNPLHYVINGYRESLINGHWFFYHYKQMILFWVIAFLLIFGGHKLMMRLKAHFADVL